MKYTIVTGASSGLGLAFTQVLASTDYYVYALVLDTAGLEPIPNVEFLKTNVTNDDDIDAVVDKVSQHGVDLLINNAGLNKDTATDGNPDNAATLGHLERDVLMKMFSVNSVSPLIIIDKLRTHMNDGSFIINISSNRASFNDPNPSPYANYGYRASKVALNMYTQALAVDMPEGINFFAVHPGSVKSTMNPSGLTNPIEAAQRILAITNNWNPINNGAYLNFDGTPRPL
jgi:NAD(P)-dependent dehydrogenase (short-subunit alcohol dehydrogenase family)